MSKLARRHGSNSSCKDEKFNPWNHTPATLQRMLVEQLKKFDISSDERVSVLGHETTPRCFLAETLTEMLQCGIAPQTTFAWDPANDRGAGFNDCKARLGTTAGPNCVNLSK